MLTRYTHLRAEDSVEKLGYARVSSRASTLDPVLSAAACSVLTPRLPMIPRIA